MNTKTPIMGSPETIWLQYGDGGEVTWCGRTTFASDVRYVRADILEALLKSDIGQQALRKLHDGQGVDTADGRAWFAAASAIEPPDGKAQFLGWQAEIAELARSCSMGEESDEMLDRLEVLNRHVSESPWMLCPDRGCILKSQEVGV